jgi:hypothetical protein
MAATWATCDRYPLAVFYQSSSSSSLQTTDSLDSGKCILTYPWYYNGTCTVHALGCQVSNVTLQFDATKLIRTCEPEDGGAVEDAAVVGRDATRTHYPYYSYWCWCCLPPSYYYLGSGLQVEKANAISTDRAPAPVTSFKSPSILRTAVF